MNRKKITDYKDQVMTKAEDLSGKVKDELKKERNPNIFQAVIAAVTIVSAAVTLKKYLDSKKTDEDL